ncbi:V-type ATP synthase subunit I [Halosegnis marinus]|uniref:A-type ATP synthase subunit I n=1 Tax=Halosegnis marinus TaxID=3034023 RepID=A0ABD5ZPQ7_9EURY|nr:V-type ATPase 116kDa subunit family protein [Halosegnis sp. DT85]
MLRPERMSRVSVTGSKGVMDDVVEAVHDLRLFDMTDYDGEWEGFEPGAPEEGADAASEKLVTVRSLESILDVDADEYDGPTRVLDDEELAAELADVRERVNALDDRRDELRDDLRAVEEDLDAVEPFVELGIDLDLLQGYESLAVEVGEGDRDAVRRALVDTDGVERHQIFGEEGTLAVFAYPGDAALEDALVGADFTSVEIPEADADPEGYVEELRARKRDLESDLEDVEDDLADLREEVGGFLLAAEEQLSVEVQKREAPLSFATTENAFVAEGWLPTDRFVDLAEGLQDEVGDHVAVEELERADYDEHGFATGPADDAAHGGAGGDAVAADGGDEEVATDGGHATAETAMSGGTPPVVQSNGGIVGPFEALVNVLNKPKYSELDPTVVLFLTFPVFFGFMIGDLGYGLLYMGIGYALMRRFDSDMVRSLGGVAVLAGLFTAIFGVLYGEFFGLHQLGYLLYPSGSAPIHKGLQPYYLVYAQAWLLLSLVVGVVHLVVGRVFDFVNNLSHGVREAFMESGSWIVFTVSLWVWVLSETALSAKPAFMYSVFARAGQTNPVTGETITSEAIAIPLGFSGFETIDLFALPVGGIVIDLVLVVVAIGLALVVAAEGGIGLVESITQGFGHVVSYTRIAAVLLAKAGMALAVNLLVFGAYFHDGEYHLIFFASGEELAAARAAEEVIFSGLLNAEGAVGLVLGGLAGILVLVLGHLLVLVLGVTSAGLQAVRLEYVEFFGKFYEGGGRDYEPFGYERRFTADE